ncbi:Scr1 family TA system antitoxin-like transcriptional regulator [Saccharopolyspora sp. ID03-671]|uniref:Scr1 family TA system antitoxin-like transcriptional regulator n=1 Tax=Saccharopolyspora sp. ID03-671 TaxID=3073066 RepID=UPI003873603D
MIRGKTAPCQPPSTRTPRDSGLEHVSAELTIDDPDQVAIYHRLMDRLRQVAAEGDEARTILRGLAAEHRDRAAS